MKLELEEYRAEAAHLKNQQATIRRLEERNRQLEQQVCFVHYYVISFLAAVSVFICLHAW
jgi:hypothetical protein